MDNDNEVIDSIKETVAIRKAVWLDLVIPIVEFVRGKAVDYDKEDLGITCQGLMLWPIGDNQTESYGSSAPDLLLRSSADESFTGVDVRYGGATTTVTGLEAGQGSEIQGRYRHDMEFDFDFDTVEKDVSTAEPVSIAGAAVTTASVAVNTGSPTRNTGVSTADDITMAETLVYIRKSSAKDKRKGKMVESKTIQTKTKLQQEQERLGFEAAVRLQAGTLRKREAVDLPGSFQSEERVFCCTRAKERRNKPPTQAQQRTYMSNYIKNMGGYTLQQLRGYSFDEIKTLFKTTMRSVNTFVPIENEVDRAVLELAAGSSKRDAEEELNQESSKRQKTGESSRTS
ncbi:hypothetical protein Tco_1405303 [Tanacetum coccineum]